MSIAWEYWGKITSSKQLTKFWGGAPGDGSAYTLVEGQSPEEKVAFTAKGVNATDMAAEKAKYIAGGQQSFGGVSGIPVNFSADPIEHTGLFNISVVLQTNGTPTPAWHFYGSLNSTRDLLEFHSGGPGAVLTVLVDAYPLKKIAGFSAKGVTFDVAQAAYETCSIPEGCTAPNGQVVQISCKQTEYTNLWDVSVSVRVDGGSSTEAFYYVSKSGDKNLTEFYEAPGTDGSYGAVTLYDMYPGKKMVTLQADCVLASEATAIEAAFDTPGGSFGDAGSKVVSYNIEQIKWTNLDNVRVTTRIQ